ncbi:hypothetical protein ACWFOS_16720 [Gordonia terrae]
MTTRHETIQFWDTTSACPVTDFVNLYKCDDGTTAESVCPCLLVQENRTTSYCTYDETGRLLSSRDEKCQPPYETRIVAAEFDMGQLEPASDAGNYLGTLHRSELDPQECL